MTPGDTNRYAASRGSFGIESMSGFPPPGGLTSARGPPQHAWRSPCSSFGQHARDRAHGHARRRPRDRGRRRGRARERPALFLDHRTWGHGGAGSPLSDSSRAPCERDRASHKRITVNPRRQGFAKTAALDSPMALGLLAAAGVIDPGALEGTLCLGELAPRALPACSRCCPRSCSRRGRKIGASSFRDNATEARDRRHRGPRAVDARELVGILRGERSPEPTVEAMHSEREATSITRNPGQHVARRALEIAAAGAQSPARRKSGHRQDDARAQLPTIRAARSRRAHRDHDDGPRRASR